MKEIKNTTIYNKEIVKKFLEIHYFEKIKVIRIVLNILIVITIISFFVKDNRGTLDIIALLCSLFGIIEINTTMLPKINLLKVCKSKDSIINTKVTYVFKKNNFNLNKDEYIDYNTLNKVIETDNSYYLYINSSRALIVDKSVLEQDEIEYLSNTLKQNVSTYKYKK